ncbi:hypothetical protein KEM52_000709 [Ascosphaera acerosa]|nr:hypothetical protein KEM52_000709 [Ascosphaera acerosa]
MAGLVFRENRVPYYQRLFQKKDGKPIWLKVRQPAQAPVVRWMMATARFEWGLQSTRDNSRRHRSRTIEIASQ